MSLTRRKIKGELRGRSSRNRVEKKQPSLFKLVLILGMLGVTLTGYAKSKTQEKQPINQKSEVCYDIGNKPRVALTDKNGGFKCGEVTSWLEDLALKLQNDYL